MTPRTKSVAWSVVWIFLAAFLALAADDQAQLKAKLERERDPIKRAELEIRLSQFKLEDASQAYEEGSPEKGLNELKEMLRLIVDAHDRMFETGRNPRKKPKGFKEAEIKLREMSRRLEDLRLSIPLEDREPVDKIIARIGEIQEHLLHGLMQVNEAKYK